MWWIGYVIGSKDCLNDLRGKWMIECMSVLMMMLVMGMITLWIMIESQKD